MLKELGFHLSAEEFLAKNNISTDFKNFKKADIVKQKSIAINVLEEKADSTVSGADNVIYIPYTNARKINKTTNVSSYVLEPGAYVKHILFTDETTGEVDAKAARELVLQGKTFEEIA